MHYSVRSCTQDNGQSCKISAPHRSSRQCLLACFTCGSKAPLQNVLVRHPSKMYPEGRHPSKTYRYSTPRKRTCAVPPKRTGTAPPENVHVQHPSKHTGIAPPENVPVPNPSKTYWESRHPSKTYLCSTPRKRTSTGLKHLTGKCWAVGLHAIFMLRAKTN